MVREAKRAGLHFDPAKMEEMNCGWDVGYDDEMPDDDEGIDPKQRNSTVPEVQITADGSPEIFHDPHHRIDRAAEAGRRPHTANTSEPPEGDPRHERKQRFHDHLHRAVTEATLHDSLMYGRGLSTMGVVAWKFMEWLPFRRMDLQDDGSWKPINWPLPRGEVRDIPDTAWIHSSALRRMEVDPKYRPGNLIVGGGGRGMIVAPEKYGMGEWAVVHERGDPVGECVVRVRTKDGRRMVGGEYVSDSNGVSKEKEASKS